MNREQLPSGASAPSRRRRVERRKADDRRAAAPGPVAQAMAAGTIEIVFQPQFALAENRLVGAEALARWPGGGDSSGSAADLFAAAAEEDSEAELSCHVQALAIHKAARWPAALDTLRLSVNVIAADLADEGFEQRIRSLLDDSGFPAERLTLEITEGALIEEIARARAHLDALRRDGIEVAVDDFGTGYSGLAWLKALPVDVLKLDRSLTADLARDGRAGVVARGVMNLAHELGLRVVAEGVETEAERARAAEEGCATWQGFLGSEPLHEQAFIAFALRAD